MLADLADRRIAVTGVIRIGFPDDQRVWIRRTTDLAELDKLNLAEEYPTVRAIFVQKFPLSAENLCW